MRVGEEGEVEMGSLTVLHKENICLHVKVKGMIGGDLMQSKGELCLPECTSRDFV